MKPISKLALPVVTMAAALISSCGGGGGENHDYYVSVQQFETGSRGFRFMASPSTDVFGNGSFLDCSSHHDLKAAFMDLVKGYDEKEGNVFGPLDPVESDKIQEQVETSGTVVSGVVSSNGTDRSPATIAYCVEGGPTGKGYLYITFEDGAGAPRFIINMLGAVVPQQVQLAFGHGGNLSWSSSQILGSSTAIMVTLNGIILRVQVDFNSGVAHMELCAQKVTTEGGDTFFEPVEIEGFEPVLTNDIPFFAINK